MHKNKQLVSLAKHIESTILIIRGNRVILDEDLANLYGISTSRLNEQVKRNNERFPSDFMFQLSKKEFDILKSQNATSSWGGRRKLPFAFTEHGALMAANVIKSPVAVNASITIVRTFVRLRKILAKHEDLARKVISMERKYNMQFKAVFEMFEELMKPLPSKDKNKEIGFKLN